MQEGTNSLGGFPEAIAQFLRHLENDRGSAANTVAAYRNDLSQFSVFVQAYRGPQADAFQVRELGQLGAEVAHWAPQIAGPFELLEPADCGLPEIRQSGAGLNPGR